jgi:phosphatidate cytidylyltransferase
MLKYRLISGFSFMGLVAAMAVWAPTWVIGLFILVLCSLAILETVNLLTGAGFPSLKWTSLAVGLLWMISAWFAASGSNAAMRSLNWIMPGLSAWAIFLGCLFRSDQSKTLPKLTGSFCTVAYVPGLMQFLLLLLFLGRGTVHQDGRMLLFYGILVIKFTDIGAYFTGCAIGKHKLIPKISPAKTWEGAVGGVLVSVLVSLITLSLFRFSVSGVSFRLMDGIALGVLLAVAGILGDLVESMLKRAADIKDSGHWIRGMGGLLDVLDSLLFAFPVLYLYVLWMQHRGF